MAMRITTKMMQNTSLNNLNTNKTLQEKLTTQMSTMKKITRPSDDPVIAIRSLKLNSSLDKIDQYYEKNTKDAESWLTLTESAIDTTEKILTSMRTYIVQASQGHLDTDDRAAILQNLTNFKNEIYSTGNADSAGRTLFTGYRTDTPLTFKEDKTEKYTITEQLTNLKLDTTTYISKISEMAGINDGNFSSEDNKKLTEYQVESKTIPRIRLAYSDLAAETGTDGKISSDVKLSYLTDLDVETKGYTDAAGGPATSKGVLIPLDYKYDIFVTSKIDDATGEPMVLLCNKDGSLVDDGTAPITGQPVTIDDLNANTAFTTLGIANNLNFAPDSNSIVISNLADPSKTITMQLTEATDADGNALDPKEYDFKDARYETKLKVTKKCATDTDEAYESVIGDGNKDKITYIASTGELLLGSAIQKELSELPLDAEIRVSYEKTNWKTGDLDPIHYFYTERTNEKNQQVVYNPEKLSNKETDQTAADQVIEYDIGSNQTIRVNTTADEVFTHDIGRDVDEVVSMLNSYSSLLETRDKIKALKDSGKYEGDDLELLTKQYEALDKECTLTKDRVQKSCEGMLTSFDGYIKNTALAQTDVGARESRLQLIQNRLSSQQTNFEELVSENEDADITQLAIDLSSVQLTYQAALSSISYVMKTTLLDFI